MGHVKVRGLIVLIFVTSVILASCGSSDKAGSKGSSDEKVLNVFNWSDYYPDFVIKQFEEETSIKVNYNIYSSNGLVFPKKGLLAWQDSLVIPKGAPHKENAEKFMDFIHRPEVMKDIVTEYPYGTSNVGALKLIPEDVRKEMDFSEEFKRGGQKWLNNMQIMF